ncbi:MAG: CPBP family intramembrane metalloprotease [Spirochaetales bacterium]|nr:MAG: CPBP family intramembrane metalloprotease [Spirochaetales bacterium]
MTNLGNAYPVPRPPLVKFVPVLFLFLGGYFCFHLAYFTFIYRYALFILLLTLVTLLYDKNLLTAARLFTLPSRRREMGLFAAACGVLVALLFLFSKLIKAPLMSGFYRASSPLSGGELMLVLLLVVIPFEEVFFRGYLQYHLSNLMGKKAGFICASLLFGLFFLMAGEKWTFVAFLAAGFYFGYLYLRTSSVVLVAALRSFLVLLSGLLTF